MSEVRDSESSSTLSFWGLTAPNAEITHHIQRKPHRDHLFSKYAQFSEKLTFLTLCYAHVRVRIRG